MKLRSFCVYPVVAAALLIGAPAFGKAPPQDLLDQEMNRLEVQIQNAMVKVRNETSSMVPAKKRLIEVQRDVEASPASKCCEGNLIAISDISVRLREHLRKLRYSLREKDNRIGTASVREMVLHLDDLEGRVKQFGGTLEKDLAFRFMELAMLALRNMREEKADLESCCADFLPPIPPLKEQASDRS